MLFVISPAKSLDTDTPAPATLPQTQPRHLSDSAALVKLLKPMKPAHLQALMDISEDLAVLNAKRFKTWKKAPAPQHTKQAILTFNGDVYDGLQASSLQADELHWAQTHVRMLSGLYGTLRPFDMMQPYRLEMGRPLVNERGGNLYKFWGDMIAKQLRKDLKEASANSEAVLVNLASQEYFKAVELKALKARVIECVFEDRRPDGSHKVISFNAKRARGAMLRLCIQQRVSQPEKLADLCPDGYQHAPEASSPDRLVFRKD
jgi:uncharacterized protein